MHYEFENVPLPYGYAALEPYIDAKTMEIHHNRHLQAYVDNLNKAIEGYPFLHTWSLAKLICNASRLPNCIRSSVKNNAGGVYNHNFYFAGMAPEQGKLPQNELTKKITYCFSSFDNFTKLWGEAAAAVFGSGYLWLAADGCKALKIVATANQDTPLTMKLCPILTIDVWEHAYYLKHYNKRGDYVSDWLKVVDWDRANRLYEETSMQSWL